MKTAWRRPAMPTGISVALGCVGVVVAALACGGAPQPSAHTVRLVVLAVVVGGLASRTGDLRAWLDDPGSAAQLFVDKKESPRG
jgi:hypothetical protein